MEEIIGLLIALGAVILKVVGNRLEKSGKKTAAPVTSDEDSEVDIDVKGWILEALNETEKGNDEPEVVFDDDGQIVEVKPVSFRPEPAPVKTDVGRVQHPEADWRTPRPKTTSFKPVPKRVILQEDDSSKKNVEKIDPKKLVIYSEIMKPKF